MGYTNPPAHAAISPYGLSSLLQSLNSQATSSQSVITEHNHYSNLQMARLPTLKQKRLSIASNNQIILPRQQLIPAQHQNGYLHKSTLGRSTPPRRIRLEAGLIANSSEPHRLLENALIKNPFLRSRRGLSRRLGPRMPKVLPAAW